LAIIVCNVKITYKYNLIHNMTPKCNLSLYIIIATVLRALFLIVVKKMLPAYLFTNNIYYNSIFIAFTNTCLFSTSCFSFFVEHSARLFKPTLHTTNQQKCFFPYWVFNYSFKVGICMSHFIVYEVKCIKRPLHHLTDSLHWILTLIKNILPLCFSRTPWSKVIQLLACLS
jgi:hypothetical protein